MDIQAVEQSALLLEVEAATTKVEVDSALVLDVNVSTTEINVESTLVVV